MSTAAAAQPKPRQIARHGFTRTPLRFFYELSKSCTYTEHVLMGLVLDATVGWHRAEAPLTIAQCMAICNVSRRAVEEARSSLSLAGYLSVDPRDGAIFYSLSSDLLPSRAPGPVAFGRCDSCHATGEVELEPDDFVQVPHTYFRQLPRACTHAEWVCVGVILAASAGRVERPRVELRVEDFTRGTGLAERTVQQALAALADEDRAVIGYEERPGRPTVYWVNVEQFAAQQARLSRTVTRERRERKGEEKANASALAVVEKAEVKPETGASECAQKVFARCRACGFVCLVKLVERPAKLALVPSPQLQEAARANSPPQTVRKPPAVTVEGLAEYLEQWESVIGSVATAEIVGQIADALHPAPLVELKRKVTKKGRWMLENARSFGLFLTFANELGEVARREASRRDRDAAIARAERERRDAEAEREWDAQREQYRAELPTADAEWRRWILRLYPELGGT